MDPVIFQLINQLDIGSGLKRALDMKGDVPDHISGGYTADVVAADLTRAEFDWPRRWGRFAIGAQVAAVAAQNSVIAFGPPTLTASRAAIILLERFIISNTGGGPILVNFGLADPSGVVTVVSANAGFTDDRVQPPGNLASPVSTANIGIANTAAPPPIPGNPSIMVPANSSVVMDIPFILTGRMGGITLRNTTFIIATNGVNVPVAATFFWRERALLPSEQ